MTNAYNLILEINKLKTIFRTNTTLPERKESTAEHSWSATMICLILMPKLTEEFPEVNEQKVLDLILTHDLVEIYAGDVIFSDDKARQDKVTDEEKAVVKLAAIEPEFGQRLISLFHEFEAQKTIESKIAKAADAICPIFLRVQSGQSYKPFNITLNDLEKKKLPHFTFSQTFTTLYHQLLDDLSAKQLI
jgi:putative hydrolases of HD superfamily